MSDQVRNPEDRFSHNEAQISLVYLTCETAVDSKTDLSYTQSVQASVVEDTDELVPIIDDELT